ncbi:MAG: class I tRNA ligase family protein [Planctomycetes bacterium]|nr:class I tRNA ligase family protein [Planctomycetota bacterium]
MGRQFFLTTAIDYPNSRPHIGTAFEKIGADVQARYRRMEGYQVFFLMGNDENTVKVARRAQELGLGTQAYCDDMARQFREVWTALDISFDDFIQTSEARHHAGCRAFIQKVFDAGHIYKAAYEGWYCDGCEAFKTEKELGDDKLCPAHKAPAVRRSEDCYYFALSKFRDRLLEFYEAHPDFIQPESRRNEVMQLVRTELLDVNITRSGQDWGIRVPFDERFTIYVWFDALLNYVTAAGYGTDMERFSRLWPADLHVIGKDITRFHCALWPAMCMAAGIAPPRRVFGHGFVYLKTDSGEAVKISKSLGNAVEPMDLVTRFSPEAFRYYFMRECPFPGDGEFGWQRFAEVYNADLANNLGNLYSRVVGLLGKNFPGEVPGTAGRAATLPEGPSTRAQLIARYREHMEALQYSQALAGLWADVLVPANQHAEKTAPWSLVKKDPPAAALVLHDLVEALRVASILLKPFLPRLSERIYRGFNFGTPWEKVSTACAEAPQVQSGPLVVMAELEGGKVKPLVPRVEIDKS